MPKSSNPLFKSPRESSSPIAARTRTRPSSQKSNLAVDQHERLDDVGAIVNLAPPDVPQDVIGLMEYIQEHTFAEIPDRAAGMNSERISEVLRFRAALPSIVSIAHLHALSSSSTNTERELARLYAEGRARKVVIPGRGKGGTAIGEGVTLVHDWELMLEQSDVDDDAKTEYLSLMNAHRLSPTAPTATLPDSHVRQLVAAGFWTNPAAVIGADSHLFAAPGTSSLLNIAKAGSRASTGTMGAVGGRGAIHESGGGGSTIATKDNRTLTSLHVDKQRRLSFSLPSTGAYLKLLSEARSHLIALLRQLSPRHREATLDVLREKWDGNVPNDPVSRQKRMRGEWTGVLPGKTRKWTQFYGLEFEWVLEEAVGAGVVELFDTGSVGLAARAR